MPFASAHAQFNFSRPLVFYQKQFKREYLPLTNEEQDFMVNLFRWQIDTKSADVSSRRSCVCVLCVRRLKRKGKVS